MCSLELKSKYAKKIAVAQQHKDIQDSKKDQCA